MFRRRPERLLNALGMFNLRPCLRGYYIYTEVHMILDQLRQSSIYKYRFYLPRFEIVQKSWNRHCNSCLKFTLSLKKNSRSFHDLNITIGKTNHYSFQINNAAFILSRSSQLFSSCKGEIRGMIELYLAVIPYTLYL